MQLALDRLTVANKPTNSPRVSNMDFALHITDVGPIMILPYLVAWLILREHSRRRGRHHVNPRLAHVSIGGLGLLKEVDAL
jgi:hypothetical protein